jgi:hypothetical protein
MGAETCSGYKTEKKIKQSENIVVIVGTPKGYRHNSMQPSKIKKLRILLYVSFKHILISLANFLGTPNL